MIARTLLTALFAVFTSAKHHDNAEPMPGSIMASLNVTSLNNIVQLAAPLAANEALNGKTFEIDYKKKGIAGLYSVDIKDISLITVDGFSIKDVSFKEGTDTLVATIGGINVNATCNAKASGLWIISGALEAFTIKNITLQVELATTSEDEVHWQLSQVTRISVDDLTLTMNNNFWQTIVDKNMVLIRIGIYTGLQKLLGKLDSMTDALNLKLKTNEPTAFITEVKEGMPMNLTMTAAPKMTAESNLININFDGRFVDSNTNTVRAVGPSTFPELVDFKQREEIFIHQSVMNSMIFDKTKKLAGANVTAEFLKAFPEVATKYGASAEVELILSFKNQADGDFDQITYSKENGIQWGDISKGGVVTDMQVMVNSTSMPTQELAVEFQTGLAHSMNFTFDNFVIFKQYSNQQVTGTSVTSSTVTLGETDLDATMLSFFTNLGNDYDASHAKGIDLKKNITVGFVSGLLKHTLLTPYMVEEYLYGGFSWITDGVW